MQDVQIRKIIFQTSGQTNYALRKLMEQRNKALTEARKLRQQVSKIEGYCEGTGYWL